MKEEIKKELELYDASDFVVTRPNMYVVETGEVKKGYKLFYSGTELLGKVSL